MFLDLKDKALAITVREGVCICGGSQVSLEITDSEFSILAWVRMPKQDKSIEVTMEGWQANGPIIGSVSLVVDNEYLIRRILKGLIHVHISTHGKNVKLSRNRWHHVAFTQYGNYLNLYLDGKLIRREPFQTYVGFRADETAVGLSYFGKQKKQTPHR